MTNCYPKIGQASDPSPKPSATRKWDVHPRPSATLHHNAGQNPTATPNVVVYSYGPRPNPVSRPRKASILIGPIRSRKTRLKSSAILRPPPLEAKLHGRHKKRKPNLNVKGRMYAVRRLRVRTSFLLSEDIVVSCRPKYVPGKQDTPPDCNSAVKCPPGTSFELEARTECEKKPECQTKPGSQAKRDPVVSSPRCPTPNPKPEPSPERTSSCSPIDECEGSTNPISNLDCSPKGTGDSDVVGPDGQDSSGGDTGPCRGGTDRFGGGHKADSFQGQVDHQNDDQYNKRHEWSVNSGNRSINTYSRSTSTSSDSHRISESKTGPQSETQKPRSEPGSGSRPRSYGSSTPASNPQTQQIVKPSPNPAPQLPPAHPKGPVEESFQSPRPFKALVPQDVPIPPNVDSNIPPLRLPQLHYPPLSSSVKPPQPELKVGEQSFLDTLYKHLRYVIKPSGNRYLSLQVPSRDLGNSKLDHTTRFSQGEKKSREILLLSDNYFS